MKKACLFSHGDSVYMYLRQGQKIDAAETNILQATGRDY